MSEFYKKIKANVEAHEDNIKNSTKVKEVIEAVKLRIEEISKQGKNSLDFKLKEYFEKSDDYYYYEFKRQIEELGFRVESSYYTYLPIFTLDRDLNPIKKKVEEGSYTLITVSWYRNIEETQQKHEPTKSWLCNLF